MISKISICNLALAQLGQSPILSLEQDDERAKRLNLFYEPVRNELLRTHHWAFANACEPLALLEDSQAGKDGFCYKYPADALFIRRVFKDAQERDSIPFTERFRRDLHARVLYIPTQTAYAEYTRRITDETLFDPAFVKTFSLALACDLAIALTGDSHLAQQLMQKYTLSLEEARRSNMTENFSRTSMKDCFTEVR